MNLYPLNRSRMIAPGAPHSFQVKGRENQILLDQETWKEKGSPEGIEMAWTETRPPSYLLVEWNGGKGVWQRSLWVVNVTDPARLPPPDELRDLPLEILVEILSSARPLHEAVRLVVERRERSTGGNSDPVIDPHKKKKVDTSNFLLRRVKRISGALEGLRTRLQRPAYNLEALRWRLHGPVGPLALAKRLSQEEGQGAAFMIAEVALMLKAVDWSGLEELLGKAAVREEKEKVFHHLKEMADGHPAPANLADYVRDSFARVSR